MNGTGSHFDVFRDSAGAFRWRLVAGNAQIVAQSEAYTNSADAFRGAADAARVAGETVLDRGGAEPVYDIRDAMH